MTGKMVCIASYSTPVVANIVKLYLESNGILCNIIEEDRDDFSWSYFNTGNTAKLEVLESEAAIAEEILNAIISDGNLLEFEKSCPLCGSTHIEAKKTTLLKYFLYFFLLYIPFLFEKSAYSCKDCGNIWKVEDKGGGLL